MARLHVRLLGSFQVELDGAPVAGFASDKVRALLAFLAIEADQPQRREKLAGLLWPDYPQASAHANLRSALANLRRVIRDAAEESPFLLVSRQTIQFSSASDAWVDAAAFTELSARADLAALDRAVGVYRGDFLEAFSLADASLFEEWALLNRERFRRLLTDALRRLAEGYGQLGEYEQALRHAWRQVELDPWQETAHQQLMRLLALSGRRAEALIQYETCCRLLAEELGVAPADMTVTLYKQIRSGELSAREHPPLLSPEPAAKRPPLPEKEATTVAERPIFVARERELARLNAWLDSVVAGAGRIAFVQGEAGSGKTSLLGEFARRAMEAYPDLLVAGGGCSVYAGLGDPFLPFREVFAMLTGDLQASWAAGSIGRGLARRLLEATPSTIDALLECGSQVLGTLVPTEALLSRFWVAERPGDSRLQRLRERLEHPHGMSQSPDESQLFQQTTNVLRFVSGTHPLLIVLDDLQWADTASLSLLFHLSRRLSGSRILLLAAYRPEEVGPWLDRERHPVEKLLAEVRRIYGDALVDLDQVEEDEGRVFLDALLNTEPNRLGPEFRAVLFEHTSGQPLFAVELLRAMQERGELLRDEAGCWAVGPSLDWARLPGRVEGVIEERLGRLDEHLLEILAVACVEGEQFTAQVLARTLDIDESRLVRDLSRGLERRHRLVRWSGGMEVGGRRLVRYRFTHALFRQHLYSGLSPGERQLLHRKIAGCLEELYHEQLEGIAPQLARHYGEAGERQQALRYLTIAGDVALRSSASEEANGHYRAALELARDGPQRAHLLEGLGHALARQNRFQEAIDAWRAAIELSQALGDVESTARLCAHSSRAAWWGGDLPHALQLCEEGLAATAEAPESAGKAHLLHEAARTFYFGGVAERAGQLCRAALRMAERVGAVEVQADALVTMGGLLGLAPQEALLLLTRAAQLAEGASLHSVAYRANNNLAVLKATIYGPLAAIDDLKRAVELSRRIGSIAQESLALTNLLEGWLAVGELEQGRACLARMQEFARELDDPRSSRPRIRRMEAAILLHQGDWLRAASLLRLCQAEARQQDDRQALLNASWLLAHALLEAYTLAPSPDRCDIEEAERALTEATEIAQVMGEDLASVWCRAHLVVLFASQGRLERAGEVLSEARTVAQDWPFPPFEVALLWGEARLAAAERRWSEALLAYESLAETCRHSELRWAWARALMDWAAALAARGEPEDNAGAQTLLEESRGLFQQMGIPRYAEVVQERWNILHGAG